MENDKQHEMPVATEEKSSAAFSDWTQKLRFDRSFSAKLILSERAVKEYYADIATEFLKYERVKTKTGWSGVSFSVGRTRFAFISITGKTLCLYLALNPEDYSDGRYKAKNVSSVKNRAKTPALLKIKSDGAKRHAIVLIDKAAENFGLKISGERGVSPVKYSDFRTDTFNNLVTRGLIRIVRNSSNRKNYDGADNLKSENFEENPRKNDTPCDAYTDTISLSDELMSRHAAYGKILGAFAEGKGSVKLSEKLMLRSVDEIWVKAVEDCINSLDELIRKPNRFISETEEVLPIELTKRISGRSVTHLCRHTDYISPNENGEITPTKMLNVFREDSLLTYENKFLNTLINRLYMFVTKRYKVAKEFGVDEKMQSMDFENEFSYGEGRGKIKISVEFSEKNLGAEVKNTFFASGLWGRVERLNGIVTGYFNSSFVKSMERNYVRPPIMRTNAILKNKYFRECLALWEFIESYEDAGYGITVNETVKEASEEYIKQAYYQAAEQYLVFRRNMSGDFADEESFSSVVKPRFSVEKNKNAEKIFEEFVYPDDENATFDDEIEAAVKVALLSDELVKDDDFKAVEPVKKYIKTFSAKLRLADENLKENFVAIANGLFKFDKVNMRVGKKFAAFNKGRRIIARASVNGKSIRLYLALNADDVPEKYAFKDVSDKKKYADTPVCLKLRSARSVKRAEELIDILAEKEKYEFARKTRKLFVEDFAEESEEDMILKGYIVPVKSGGFKGFPLSVSLENESVLIGPEKNPDTEKTAENAEMLSVTERNMSADTVGVDESVLTPDNADIKEDIASAIDEMIRPESDYSKPTNYGIDDTSGFMKDAEESTEYTDSADKKDGAKK